MIDLSQLISDTLDWNYIVSHMIRNSQSMNEHPVRFCTAYLFLILRLHICMVKAHLKILQMNQFQTLHTKVGISNCYSAQTTILDFKIQGIIMLLLHLFNHQSLHDMTNTYVLKTCLPILFESRFGAVIKKQALNKEIISNPIRTTFPALV